MRKGTTRPNGKPAWNRKETRPMRTVDGRYEVEVAPGRWLSRQRAHQLRQQKVAHGGGSGEVIG